MNELIQFCSELIQRDSSAMSKNITDVPEYIISKLKQMNLKYEIIEKQGIKNIVVEIKNGKSDKTMAICAHWDTVNSSELWTIDPFSGEIKDKKIWGLGASDDKAQIAAMLELLRYYSLEQLKFKGVIRFFFCGDEEHGGRKGIVPILNTKYSKNISYVINGEPTNLEIQIARRGAVSGHIIVKGKQIHSSIAVKSENAILNAVKIINKLDELNFKPPQPPFSNTTFSITKFHAGDLINIVPGIANIFFDCRFSPPETIESVKKKIMEKVRFALDENKFEIQFRNKKLKNPFISKDGELRKTAYQVVEEITGKKPVFRTTGGASDARYFVNIPNIQIIEFGSSGDRMHGADEYVRIDTMECSFKVYKSIIEKLLC